MGDILNRFTDKKILIWGYGREGRSTESFFKKRVGSAEIEISEKKPDEIEPDKYDYIFKSPGIRLKYPTLEGFGGEFDKNKITSQTELFLEAFRDRVIGITGTKGKSTTTALTHHVLDKGLGSLPDGKYKTAYLVGNIGVPCLDYYDEMTDETAVAVFELSCHQLAYTRVSPHIALFLNLYEDHLDFYGDRATYFQAKRHITEFQSEGDYLFLGTDVPELSTKARVSTIKDKYESNSMNILGEHNRYNAMFTAKIAGEVFGLSDEVIRSAIDDFSGLAHRLQLVLEKDGVGFYDDSISTIPEAAIQAVESVPDTATLLIGGMDREIDYTPLTDFIIRTPEVNFICMYASGKRIYDEVLKKADTSIIKNIQLTKDLKEAVECAKKITPAGKAVVLSPAAASYGYFKNFEERGDVFAQLVRE